MKTMMKNIKTNSAKPFQRAAKVFAGLVLVTGIFGCSTDTDDGTLVGTTTLPTEDELILHCPDVGIFDETCILEDPNNPFARVGITEENKFDLEPVFLEDASIQARFYFWGTAMAITPLGDNQFQIAVALHELFTITGDEALREQTQRAYRSVLDNFFNDFIFFEFFGNNVGFPLSDFTGIRLVEPETEGLAALYDTPDAARTAMGEWGYAYNPDTQTVVTNRE